jgi:hypothetical protein
MSSLRYTNFLLTLIALCVVYLCVRETIPPHKTGFRARAAAYSGVQEVEVVNTPTVEIDGTPTVELAGGEADVNISGVFGKVWKNPDAHWGMPVSVIDSCQLDVDVIDACQLEVDVGNPELDVNVTNFGLPVEVIGMP